VSKQPLVLSANTVVRQHGTSYALHHRHGGKLFIIPKDAIHVFRKGMHVVDLADSKFEEIYNAGIVKYENETEDYLVRKKQEIFSKSQIKEISIVPTYMCNMSCKHCMNKQNSTDTIKENRNALINQLDNLLVGKNYSYTVRLIGGEPLYDIRYMQMIVEKVQKEAPKSNIVISTNGNKLNKILLHWMHERNININISINTIDSWSVSILKTIGKSGLNYAVSVIIDPDCVEKGLCVLDYCVNIGVNKVNILRKMYVKYRNVEKYAENMYNIYKKYKSCIRIDGRWILLLRKQIYDRHVFADICSANGSGVCILPDGKLTSCYMFPQQSYNDLSQLVSSDFRVEGLRRRVAVGDCHGCEIQGICGGGCRAEYLSAYRNQLCSFYRSLINVQLGDVAQC